MAKKVIQAQMQQRRDTAANWAASNPVLLEGELGIVTDDPNLYKIGDGVTAWNDLKFRGFDGTLVQTTGDSENAAMSQKAVTEKLTELESETDLRVSIKPGKNLFDKDSVIVDCRFLSDGTIQKNDYTIYFAITGYIPCEPLTSYNLTKEGNSSVVSTGSYCCFYTKDLELISTKEGSFTNFTTPENCTYMRLTVLKDALNSKIQLQKGITYRTEYEEYQPIEGYLEAVKNLVSEVSLKSNEFDVNLSNIEDAIGVNHQKVNIVNSLGNYARVNVFSNINLEKGKKYIFNATTANSGINYIYVYVVDSAGTVLQTKGGTNGILYWEYIPNENIDNASIRISSDVALDNIKCLWYESQGNNKIVQIEEQVNHLFNGKDLVELSIVDKFFVTSLDGYEGDLANDDKSCATSYIPVKEGNIVRIDNVFLESYRSVCAYDENREFLSVIGKQSYDTSLTFKVPNNCRYIRATGKIGVAPIVTYLSIPYGIEDICINNIADISITNGKYITRYVGVEGATSDDLDSAATDFIKVIPNAIISIEGAYFVGNRCTCAYDKNKKFVSVLVSSVGETQNTKNIQLPSNAYYIRITSAKDVVPSVKYVNTIVDGKHILPMFITNEQLFEEAAAPVLSFVDDDTWGVRYVERLKGLCDSLGIKISFACLTEQVEKEDTLLETLLSFEQDGFPIIFHGNQQINAYRGATPEDLIEQERDFVKGLQKMHKFGFSDYKIWVTPFGGARPDQRALAMKWGMEAIITSAYIDSVNNPYKREDFNRYRILRNGLGNNMPMSDEELRANVNNIKVALDKAKQCNGWCLVSMHSAFDMFIDGTMDEYISEIVNYARDNGIEIRTVNEELRRRRPIFNYYEQY